MGTVVGVIIMAVKYKSPIKISSHTLFHSNPPPGPERTILKKTLSGPLTLPPYCCRGSQLISKMCLHFPPIPSSTSSQNLPPPPTARNQRQVLKARPSPRLPAAPEPWAWVCQHALCTLLTVSGLLVPPPHASWSGAGQNLSHTGS